MDERASQEAKRAQAVKGAIEPSCFEARRTAGRPRRAEDLHICPACASELVYPVTWEPADHKRWSVSLRCPECDWAGGGIHEQAAVDRFDEALDRGTEEMIEDLKALARANMEEQINSFVAALAADRILPEDF